MNVKLGYALWEAANMPNNRSVKQMQPLAHTAKHWRFEGLAPCGWRQAQTTGGGLALTEVEPTFQFKGCPGLYFVGKRWTAPEAAAASTCTGRSAAALPPGGTPQSTFAAENGNRKGTRESPRAFPRPFYYLNQAALFSPLESSFARSSAGRSARYSTTAQAVEATLFTKVTPPAILVSACATVYSCPKMYTLRK